MSKELNEIYTIECTNMAYAPDPVKVLYVEREYDWYMNQFVYCHMDKFTRAFETLGYEFCYIPQMLNAEVQESNDKQCLAMLRGEAEDVPEALKLAYCARQIVRAQGKMRPSLCKFSHYENDRAVFYCMELDDDLDTSLVILFYDFVRAVKKLDEQYLLSLEYRKEEDATVDSFELVDPEEVMSEEEQGVAADLELLRAISSRLRKNGVSEERIQEAVIPQKQLSRLLITQDKRILLPDYNKEIELDPLHKAVFLLFLKHPDGIRFKEVSEYKSELLQLYIGITNKPNSKRASSCINDICSPFKNSIHEKCSRIRKILAQVITDKDMASHYCISGKRGEAKCIDLPRTMVTWE